MDFDQVYRAFFRDVLFYVWGLCGDRVLAEEIAQETFFKALKSIDRFDGQGDIRPWLFAISKEVFTLRVFGELPFEKIGQLFGKSASWARVTYYRAKQKVTAYMEEMEHE